MANVFKERPKSDYSMDVRSLLDQKGLVVKGPTADEINETIARVKDSNAPIKLLYGETFDEKGNPVDSLKYYLFIDLFSKLIEQEYKVQTNPIVLIADLGMYRNFPDQIDQMKSLAATRATFAEKVKEIYNCKYDIVLMSDLVKTTEFEATCESIKSGIMQDKELVTLIEKTVPEDRLEMERKRNYIYSIEELAVISNLDFKIGPPREELYDNLANVIAPKLDYKGLLGVYLYPTYPLGLQFGEYMSSSSVKQYGLTPYKVGSSNFSKNRIALGTSTLDTIRVNFEKTQISKSESKPNPIMDLAMITNLARQHLDPAFSDFEEIYKAYYNNNGKLNSNDLKKVVLEEFEKYVLNKF